MRAQHRAARRSGRSSLCGRHQRGWRLRGGSSGLRRAHRDCRELWGCVGCCGAVRLSGRVYIRVYHAVDARPRCAALLWLSLAPRLRRPAFSSAGAVHKCYTQADRSSNVHEAAEADYYCNNEEGRKEGSSTAPLKGIHGHANASTPEYQCLTRARP